MEVPGPCPPESVVLDFVQGRLDRESEAHLEAHLDGCAACRRLVAALALGGDEVLVGMAPSTVEARGAAARATDATDAAAPGPAVPAPRSSASDWPVGAVLASRFEVLRRIGRGGMGTAYEAEDLELRQRVALKVLHPHLGRSEVLRERIRREIVVGRRVSHPNVVRIYDLGLAADTLFFTMELVDGETLATRLAKGRLEPEEAVHLLLQVVAALEASHGKGVVHRDIKPSNVMVGPERTVTVMDFGLAFDAEVGTVERRAAAGTPGYWAPEQAAGEGATAQSDLYSVGLVAYELLLGHRPPSWWDGDLSGVPPALRPVLRRCLAAKPGDRFASATELRRALVEARERLGRDGAEPPPEAIEPDGFVGRAAELAELERLVAAGARVITLVGPPGVGKSRLARRFAELAGGGRAVVTCNLAMAQALAQVCADLARALGLPLGGEETDMDPLGRVGRALAAAGRPLVLLDNMDRVVRHAPATVGRWLDLAPEACFLVTSRERLRLPGAHTLEVLPLSLPEVAGGAPLAAEAVRLFLDRARAARPELRLGDDDLAAVARLVRRLDGVPLAIELAASRVRLMSPAQLEARLAERLDLLDGADCSEPGARSSLRAALEWSWTLLGAPEQAVLARCSVFASPFTYASAEAVVGPEAGVSAAALLDVLGSLRDRSLLAAAPASGVGEPRLRLLGSVREHLAGTLEPGASRSLRRRHGVHFVAAAEGLLAELEGRGSASASVELGELGDELQVVLDHAEAASDPDLALRAALALDGLLGRLGPPDLHLSVLDRALAVPDADSGRRAVVLARRGAARVAHGDLEGAGRDLAEARRRASAMGDEETVVRCLLAQSRRAFVAGALPEAVGHARGARDRALGRFPLLAGRALAQMAASLAEEGAIDEAALRGGQALDLARDHGDRLLEAEALVVLGRVALIRGDLEGANATFGEALAIHQALRERRLEGQTLERLALVAEEADRLEQAKALGERALDIAREVGDRHLEIAATIGLGMVCHDQGALDEADRLYSQALHRGAGTSREAPFLLGYRALLEQERGHIGEAHALHGRAIEAFEAAGNRRFVGVFSGTLGALLHEAGRFEEAGLSYGRAVALCREVEDPRAESMFLGAQAALMADRGDLAVADSLLVRGQELLGEGRSRACAEELRVHSGNLEVARARVAAASGDREPEGRHRAAAEAILRWARSPSSEGAAPVGRALMIRLAVRLLERALEDLRGA